MLPISGLGDVLFHMPFTRLAHGRLVANPGSVGMPYGRPGAHWAMLGPGIQLRATESTYPEAAEFADYFLNARAGDAEALRVFGPRDGREA